MIRGPFGIAIAAAMVLAVLWLAFGSSGDTGGMSDGQLAAVVQLGLLGVVLAFVGRTYLSGYGVSQTMKAALAWVGLIVVLVAGYAYKDELQDVAHRVSLGLVPGSAVTRLSDDGTARVTIGRDFSGHYSVEGVADGTAIEFLVDTGATTTALSFEDASRVGIDVERLNFSIPISTANGMALAAPARIRELSIGGIERRDVQATVSERGALSQSLLGMNFVGTLSSFEIRGDRLVLSD